MQRRDAFFRRVSASLIVPITFLPLAAILLAIGQQAGIEPVRVAGEAVIRSWLPLFYGIGISIGFTDGDAMGALTVATGFTVMVAVAETVSGDPSLNLGVLGGVVAGALCTWLYNRVKHVKLPEFLALFSGKRMGPLVATIAGVALGYGFGYAWPGLYAGVKGLGNWIYESGGVGVFVYGGVLRLLIPTGLHHILMQLVDTQLGAFTDPATGKIVMGEYLRFLAGDPNAGRLLSGFFLTLGFGPLGAALAIAHEARPEQRRKVTGLMTTGILTAMLLGVTEPIEFAYIFASPVLFGIHVLYSALASLAGYMLNIRLGGYALPMALFNWHLQENGWMLFLLAPIFTALYYVTFRAVIRWMRPPILGQVAEESDEAAPVDRPAAKAAAAQAGDTVRADEGTAYLRALGGAGNIQSLEACMTRLRLEVADPQAMDEGALRRLGAIKVLKSGQGVQVVVGARAGDIAALVRSAMTGRAQAVPVPCMPAPDAAEATPAVGGTAAATLVSPLTGRLHPLESLPDPVFAQRLMGDGVAIEPASDGTLVAPASGQIVHVFPGGHAIGLITPEGLELLIHVGIDTVALKGQGFDIAVREGDQVEAGRTIGRFDPGAIRLAGKSLLTPVLVTNMDRVQAIRVVDHQEVAAGAPLMTVELK